jgi:hypothetical protein
LKVILRDAEHELPPKTWHSLREVLLALRGRVKRSSRAESRRPVPHRFPDETEEPTVVELLEQIGARLGLNAEQRLEVFYAKGRFWQMYVHERIDRQEQDCPERRFVALTPRQSSITRLGGREEEANESSHAGRCSHTRLARPALPRAGA